MRNHVHLILFAVALFLETTLVLTAASAQELRIATWNIENLTTGKKVFPDQRYVRKPEDIKQLREFAAARIDADVVALQEIASPAAAAQVFPLSEWTICISGQFFEFYPDHKRTAVKAECFATSPLPDTPNSADYADQFTALVIRKGKAINVNVADIREFGVQHRYPNGVEKPTRWGLTAKLTKDGLAVTILNIHLKTGCFHYKFTTPQTPPPSTDDCETFARQIPYLDKFVRETPIPFIVLGDFNRHLDLQRDQVWDQLSGGDTRDDKSDDTKLWRYPYHKPSKCLQQPAALYNYVPVDYIVLSKGLSGSGDQEDSPDLPVGKNPYKFKSEFGDHCPLSLTVFPSNRGNQPNQRRNRSR
jgi:endonuclease/exonuclease/phosphatase family metal-dependent hydrolase